MKNCQYCDEEIQDESIKCEFCGEILKTVHVYSCNTIIEKYKNKEIVIKVDQQIKDIAKQKLQKSINYSSTKVIFLLSILVFLFLLFHTIISFYYSLGFWIFIIGIILIFLNVNIFGREFKKLKTNYWYLPFIVIIIYISFIIGIKSYIYISLLGLLSLLNGELYSYFDDNEFIYNDFLLYFLWKEGGIEFLENGKKLGEDDIYLLP